MFFLIALLELFLYLSRPIGSDIQEGSLVLESGTYIGVAEMGLLAACGNYKISVQKHPSIGILSTGDELQETGIALEPGHVYDSNRITLISLLKENNYNATDFGIAVDEYVYQNLRMIIHTHTHTHK